MLIPHALLRCHRLEQKVVCFTSKGSQGGNGGLYWPGHELATSHNIPIGRCEAEPSKNPYELTQEGRQGLETSISHCYVG
jgi:hypothetical protein